MALRTLSLCAGYGGLDLGVKLARPDAHLVGVVERQAYCAAVLVARMEEARLGFAPIWDDLATFDGRRWRGAVDLITAGYPCQPESEAGLRLGEADDRWLWGEVWRVVREVEPGLVFLENVAGHLSGTFGRVLGDMAALGWRVEWDCIPACAVGAPHERDRVFVLAGPAPISNAYRPRDQRSNGEDALAWFVERPWNNDPSGPEPRICRMDDGAAARMDRDWQDRIYALGNGVVPAAAAHAWRTLESRLMP